MLTELKSRGIERIVIACMDGLKGFPDAVKAVFPDTEIQLCMVHMLRSSLKLVPHKDKKAVAAALKQVYNAPAEEGAKQGLQVFKGNWNEKYPLIARQWENKWENLNTIFHCPEEIRSVIYTTNTIESLNASPRKITRNRKIFQGDESALKIVTLGILEASKKWTMPIKNWAQALSFFALNHPEIMSHISSK